MKIKMLVNYFDKKEIETYKKGSILDVEEGKAKELIKLKYAKGVIEDVDTKARKVRPKSYNRNEPKRSV